MNDSSFEPKGPFFSMGPNTVQVSVDAVFGANRRKLCAQLATATPNNQGSGGVVVFLKGGPSAERFDSDHEPIFRQESYFWYLTGVKEPDCMVVVDCCTCNDTIPKTTLLVPRLPPSYATIMGKIRSLEEWKELYQVDAVQYTDQVDQVLLEALDLRKGTKQDEVVTVTSNGTSNGYHRNGLSNNNGSSDTSKKLLLMKGRNSDSGNMYEPPTIDNKAIASRVDTDTLFPILAECRVTKSPAELHLLRQVTEITSFAHAYVMRNMKPGMMEYQAESLFRHYCYFNYGCRLVGYTPICGCGPNAAVLHYGHAGEPNARQSTAADTGLFDMGAEYFGYGSDVTCSWPVSGQFNQQQKTVFRAVYDAQVAVYEMMKPGVSYVDCHKAAEAAILEALREAGLVVLPTNNDKTIRDLVELRLGAVFMPHGLGHLIGIDTHDVGGYLPGHPERSPLPGLKSLRTARVLRANMTLTVEPGCYFIDHLLDEALADGSPLQGYLNADALQAYRGFGGVRLEDVVQVTATGIVNYTLCPRTISEIESVMAGGKWPPLTDEAPELRRVRLTDPTPLPSPPSL